MGGTAVDVSVESLLLADAGIEVIILILLIRVRANLKITATSKQHERAYMTNSYQYGVFVPEEH